MAVAEVSSLTFHSTTSTPPPEIRKELTFARLRPEIAHSVVWPTVAPGGKMPVMTGTSPTCAEATLAESPTASPIGAKWERDRRSMERPRTFRDGSPES